HLTHPKCTHISEHTHCEHTPGAVGSHLCCNTQGTVSPSVRDPAPRDPSCWTYYHKPIFILTAGGLALATGLVIILNSSRLFKSHSTNTNSVDNEMGPLCFSVGMMFAVLGGVWVWIIKENVKHKRQMI
uniref:Uncharacterized protein n=2 Tax=Cyprinus carpio TaxID=7962 RepID=A0A9J7ZTC5_CYPCA